jgi:hypothetical protein
MLTVTREQAFKIAESYLKTHSLGRRTEIYEILSIEEVAHQYPRTFVYTCPAEKMKDYWFVCYLVNHISGLHSTLVILVHKETGSVDHLGSTFDEG